MELYDIIKALQNASGSNAKQSILEQNKDNELLKAYIKAVYDPGINYWTKKCPKVEAGKLATVDAEFIEWIIDNIAGRKVTGKAAESLLKQTVACMDEEGQELVKLLIDRSIGAGIGETIVLKVWPNLFFTVGYQRCSLLDKKAKEKFSKLSPMFVQEKKDGSFLYLIKEAGSGPQAITRAGSRYPAEFAAKLAKGVPDGSVLVGEMLVYEDVSTHGDWVVLDRQTGNGILNSVLKGGDIDEKYTYRMTAWDFLTPEEFKAGKSEFGYTHRLDALAEIYAENVEPIATIQVSHIEQAYEIYSSFTAQEKEGAVLKTTDFLWKDGTSKDCVKMKIEFEIDLEVEDIVEGTGKYVGMMGAVKLKSRCGKLRTDVGTGFSDKQRKDIFEFGLPKVVAIKANDIIGKRGSDTFSCFLPVFLEERLDKTEADSYDECLAILNAAKGLK